MLAFLSASKLIFLPFHIELIRIRMHLKPVKIAYFHKSVISFWSLAPDPSPTAFPNVLPIFHFFTILQRYIFCARQHKPNFHKVSWVSALWILTAPIGYHWQCVRCHYTCAVSRDLCVWANCSRIFEIPDFCLFTIQLLRCYDDAKRRLLSDPQMLKLFGGENLFLQATNPGHSLHHLPRKNLYLQILPAS